MVNTSIKRILCALDLSQQSETVAAYANNLATALGAEIIAVYAAPSLTQYVGFHVPPSSIENFVGEIVSGAEKTMQEFVVKHFAGLKAKGLVVNGYAAEEIIKTAKENDADLILMGTHGRTGINRILFGSVAEGVVKTAHIPVMTIRPQEEEE